MLNQSGGTQNPLLAATPGINPAAAMPAPQGMMGRLGQTLFGNVGPGGQMDSEAARKLALLQMGLGMMAAGSQGQGFGQGVFNSYLGAANTFQGAMDRAYQNSERKRLEEKEDRQRQEGFEREDVRWSRDQAITAKRDAERRQHEKTMASTASPSELALAQSRRLDQQEQERQRKLLEPLFNKIRSGQQLTRQEMELYQLIATGRMAAPDPLGGMSLDGGGLPMQGGGNPRIERLKQ